MSSAPLPKPDRTPLISLVHKAHLAFQAHMVRQAQSEGFAEVKQAHNAVFATLLESGSRATDMAARAGITRQSMGEVIREMVGLGILEMRPDPEDRRAKLVTYTDYGLAVAKTGYQHLVDLERRFEEEVGADDYESMRAFLEWLPDYLQDDDQIPVPRER